MAEILEPGRGKVEFAEAFKAYAAAYRMHGKRPVPPEDFSLALKRLCRSSGINLKADGDHVYLIKVRLKETEARVTQ